MRGDLLAEFAYAAGQDGGAAGRFAEPEGQAGRRAVGVFDEHASGGLDALHAPTGVAQQDDVAGRRFDGKVLVEGGDLHALGLQHHAEDCGVRDGPSVGDGGGARAAAGVELAVDAIAQQVGAVASAGGLNPLAEQPDQVVEEGAGEVAIGVGAAQDVEECGLVPWLGGHAGDDLLHQHVGGLRRNLQAVEFAGAHLADEGGLLQQVVAGGGKEAALGDGPAPMAGAADALHGDSDGAGAGDLADQVDVADVDAEFQRSSGDEDADFAILQALLGIQAELAGERAMVGGDAVRAKLRREPLGQGEGELLHQAAGVDEDERGAVRQRVGGETVEDLLPHGVGGHGAEFVGRNFDGEVEGAALADLDNRGGPGIASGQELGD